MRKPRICLISHIYLERRHRSKLSYLAQDVELDLVSPDRFESPYGLQRADFAGIADYRVRVYPCWFPLGVRTSTRWLLASHDLGLRASPPDILHVENEVHSLSLLQAVLYQRHYAPRARVVVSVWANQRLRGAIGFGLNLLARLLRPGIDAYISGNTDGKALLIESGVLPERIAVFPLVGVDTDHYRPVSAEERARLRKQLGIPLDAFVIGYVGRFVNDKGLPDLLAALEFLRSEPDGVSTRLLCVGNGPLKPSLHRRAPEVIVASPGGGKVLPYYQVLDVIVLPSRTMPNWKEQFGRALVEAMACGVPVVGSSSGAIPEVIGEGGKVFPEGNVAEMQTILLQLRHSEAVRRQLGERGLRRVHDLYSEQQIARQTYDVYCKAAGPGARRS